MMGARTCIRVFALATVLCCWLPSFSAEPFCNSEYLCGLRSPTTLKHLHVVFFQVHTFGHIDKDELTKTAVAALRRAGIRLMTEEERRANPISAQLDLSMTLVCESRACGYTTRLELKQPVRLVRDQSISNVATTWDDGYAHALPYSDRAALLSRLRVDVDSLIRDFTDDYVSANR